MPLEDFLAVAECGDRATLHDGNLVRSGENTHSMGDDDHRGVGDLHLFNGIQEHAFADVVEAGVRLVENHKARVTKKGPSKAETLAKSSRKNEAPTGNRGVIPLRQAHDRVMDSGELRGFDDLLEIGIIEPSNIVPYRFPKEVDVLGQISEVTAAPPFAQDRHVNIIEQDSTVRRQ